MAFSDLKKLHAEKASTLARIAEIEAKIKVCTNPSTVRRYRATINGQRSRLGWIERYIAELEATRGEI